MILRIIATTLNGLYIAFNLYGICIGSLSDRSENSPMEHSLGMIAFLLIGFILPALNILAIWWGRLKLKREAVPKV